MECRCTLKRNESECKLRSTTIEAHDSVERQSADIATETRLYVLEQDQDQMVVMPGSSIELASVVMLGDKTGPADSWGVPAAVQSNFNMKIAAIMLGDSEVLANELDVPVANKIGTAQSMPGFRNKMKSQRQGSIPAHEVFVIPGAVVQPKTPQALKIKLGNKTGPANSLGDPAADQPQQ